MNAIIRPTLLASVQTDGSFNMDRVSRTAVILTTPSGEKYNLAKTYFTHDNSTESEWRSIFDGLAYCHKKDQLAVKLENDNLGVINSLIRQERPKKVLYNQYYDGIYRIMADFEWVETRWIPRRLNMADKLFRI
jgi:ribonuclease HI